MPRKRKDPLDAVREQLLPAAAEALTTLRRTMCDETASPNLQVDCAKELLNRAFGKAALAAPEEARDPGVTVVLSDEADAFSR